MRACDARIGIFGDVFLNLAACTPTGAWRRPNFAGEMVDACYYRLRNAARLISQFLTCRPVTSHEREMTRRVFWHPAMLAAAPTKRSAMAPSNTSRAISAVIVAPRTPSRRSIMRCADRRLLPLIAMLKGRGKVFRREVISGRAINRPSVGQRSNAQCLHSVWFSLATMRSIKIGYLSARTIAQQAVVRRGGVGRCDVAALNQ